MSLIIRKRVRAHIRARCKDWGIPRERIPRSLIEEIEQAFETLIETKVCTVLSPPDPPPPKPKLHKSKPPSKRCLKSHPTLF